MALKRSTLVYYGLTELPVMMSIFPVLVFIPKYYTSDLGVPLALASTIILAVRIVDVVTDPLCGCLCDRTNTRWGRRRPWVVAAAPVIMFAVYKLFLPPEDADGFYLGLWMLVMGVGTTMMLIPYYAWAAELSPDYNERSRITGVRSMMGVVGNFLAQFIPLLALWIWGIGGSGNVLTIVGITMLVVMPICVALTVTNVGEPEQFQKTQVPLLTGIRFMLKNAPFLRLITAFGIASTALSMTTPLYLFFISFVLHAEDKAPYMLACFYTANLCSVPFWVWLSEGIGKHRAYIGSFSIIAFAHPLYLLLGEGDFWWMLPITLLTGFAAGGFHALPNSMKADVIDLDHLQSGENRAGVFFATWSFTYKLAASFGTWLALAGLGWFAFNPSPEMLNTPEQLFGLRFLFALAPSLFYLGACVVIWNYPITREKHAEVRAELDKLDSTRAAAV